VAAIPTNPVVNKEYGAALRDQYRTGRNQNDQDNGRRCYTDNKNV
jgi:hypothetical protein